MASGRYGDHDSEPPARAHSLCPKVHVTAFPEFPDKRDSEQARLNQDSTRHLTLTQSAAGSLSSNIKKRTHLRHTPRAIAIAEQMVSLDNSHDLLVSGDQSVIARLAGVSDNDVHFQ